MNVVFILYDRPVLTERVFAEIRKARPERLFVVADGPHLGKPNDADRVAASRAAVDSVDWPCEVSRNYSDINLGCMRRVSTGLDWVFSQVDEAIILEDDCVPHPDFFRFCTELLDRYRRDQRVGHIGAVNFDRVKSRTEYSYFFSRYPSIWGWATWRRAWQQYDVNMTLWPRLRASGWHCNVFPTRGEARYFEQLWDDLVEARLDAWGGRWVFSRLVHGTVSIRPCVNLVSNIGFGNASEASHTTFQHFVGNFPVQPLSWPLKHPPRLIQNEQSDRGYARIFFRLVDPKWAAVGSRWGNKYWYGRFIRRIPAIGCVWKMWRSIAQVRSAEPRDGAGKGHARGR
jgi:hypothetical protein